MKNVLNEINRLIEKTKRKIVSDVAVIAICTLFVLCLCYMGEKVLAVFYLVSACPLVCMASNSFRLLDGLYGQKARVEFCIEKMGCDDETKKALL